MGNRLSADDIERLVQLVQRRLAGQPPEVWRALVVVVGYPEEHTPNDFFGKSPAAFASLFVDRLVQEGRFDAFWKVEPALEHLIPQQKIVAEAELRGALESYLTDLDARLSVNRLLQKLDPPLQLDDLRIPLQVLPFEPVRDHDEARAREKERLELLGRSVDAGDEARTIRRAYHRRPGSAEDAEAKEQQYRQPQPLDALAPQLEIAALLGDPGSGKTEWLKRHTRDAVALSLQSLHDNVALDTLIIPVFLRLDTIHDAFVNEQRLLSYLRERGCSLASQTILSPPERVAAAILVALRHEHAQPLDLLAPWLWQRMISRRDGTPRAALLLSLDAWDEVTGEKADFAVALHSYAEQFPVQIILTSRIVGYSQRPLPVANTAAGPRRELQLCHFTPADAERFVTSFFTRQPDLGTQLIHELRDKPTVAGMLQNPLLATLLCMAIAQGEGGGKRLELPARRGEVYQRVLDGLLGTWSTEEKRRAPKRQILKRQRLEAAAYHLFPYELLRGSDLLGSYALSQDEPLLQELCDDGVLVPCGHGVDAQYLFLHLTFQEYLAASYLAGQVREHGWTAAEIRLGTSERAVRLAMFLHHKAWAPEWQEVIVLLAGLLDDPAPLLLLLADATMDDMFRHRLALAARCVGELPGVIVFHHRALVEQISQMAFEVWWQHLGHVTQAAVRQLERSLPAVAWADRYLPVGQLLTRVATLLADQNASVRYRAVEAVGRLGNAATTPAILDPLATLLADQNARVRYRAAEVVGRLGSATATPAILDRLATLLTDQDTDVRKSAAEVVSRLGSAAATPAFLNHLATLLADQDMDMRKSAAEVVGRLGSAAATSAILDRLATLLADQNASARYRAAEIVGRLGSAAATPAILDRLTALLGHQDMYVRRRAIEVVGRLGSAAATPAILDRLTTLLADQNMYMRDSAAEIVGRLGSATATPASLDRLTALPGHQDTDVRRRAAEVVSRLGSAAATPAILDLLATLLADQNANVRRRAAEVVGRLGSAAATPAILDCLATLLTDQYTDVRKSAAGAVGALGSAAATPAILARLATLLADQNTDVRNSAAEAVGVLGSAAATPAFLDRLATLLADQNTDVRNSAAEAVGALGSAAATPAILDRLATLLADQNWGVRDSTAKAVSAIHRTHRLFLRKRWMLIARRVHGQALEQLATIP